MNQANPAPAAAVPATQQFHARCSGCGATLSYSATAGKLKCEYCGHETEISSLAGKQAIVEHDLDEALAAASTAARGLGRATRSVTCESCGATVQVAPDVVADRCDFCGSPRVAMQSPAE